MNGKVFATNVSAAPILAQQRPVELLCDVPAHISSMAALEDGRLFCGSTEGSVVLANGVGQDTAQTSCFEIGRARHHASHERVVIAVGELDGVDKRILFSGDHGGTVLFWSAPRRQWNECAHNKLTWVGVLQLAHKLERNVLVPLRDGIAVFGEGRLNCFDVAEYLAWYKKKIDPLTWKLQGDYDESLKAVGHFFNISINRSGHSDSHDLSIEMCKGGGPDPDSHFIGHALSAVDATLQTHAISGRLTWKVAAASLARLIDLVTHVFNRKQSTDQQDGKQSTEWFDNEKLYASWDLSYGARRFGDPTTRLLWSTHDDASVCAIRALAKDVLSTPSLGMTMRFITFVVRFSELVAAEYGKKLADAGRRLLDDAGEENVVQNDVSIALPFSADEAKLAKTQELVASFYASFRNDNSIAVLFGSLLNAIDAALTSHCKAHRMEWEDATMWFVHLLDAVACKFDGTDGDLDARAAIAIEFVGHRFGDPDESDYFAHDNLHVHVLRVPPKSDLLHGVTAHFVTSAVELARMAWDEAPLSLSTAAASALAHATESALAFVDGEVHFDSNGMNGIIHSFLVRNGSDRMLASFIMASFVTPKGFVHVEKIGDFLKIVDQTLQDRAKMEDITWKEAVLTLAHLLDSVAAEMESQRFCRADEDKQEFISRRRDALGAFESFRCEEGADEDDHALALRHLRTLRSKPVTSRNVHIESQITTVVSMCDLFQADLSQFSGFQPLVSSPLLAIRAVLFVLNFYCVALWRRLMHF